MDPEARFRRRTACSRRSAGTSGCGSGSFSASTTPSPPSSTSCDPAAASTTRSWCSPVTTASSGASTGYRRGARTCPTNPPSSFRAWSGGPASRIERSGSRCTCPWTSPRRCVALAGATPDLPLDGSSLTEVIADPQRFDDRQLLYERGSQEGYSFPTRVLPPLADGVFTRHRKFVRYRTAPPVYELYDLDADPGELQNVVDDPRYVGERSRSRMLSTDCSPDEDGFWSHTA